MTRSKKWFRVTRRRLVIDYVDIQARSKRSAMATVIREPGMWDNDTKVVDVKYDIDEFGKVG